MLKTSTTKKLAVVDEAECIGCAKCLPACPFDAILGANKQMHTVLADECIGCQLCVPACPVDCITMIETPTITIGIFKTKIVIARQRYRNRKERLTKKINFENPSTDKKNYIQAALQRAKQKGNKPV